MKYVYKPQGVCSIKMEFDINDKDNTINDLKVIGGCNGNLKGIVSLIKGMRVDEVINKLNGIKCNLKNTSCPDQISKGLKEYLENIK